MNEIDDRKLPGDELPKRKIIHLPAPAWNIWHIIMVFLSAVVLSMLPYLLYDSAGSIVGVNILGAFLQYGAFIIGPCFVVCILYKQPAAMLGIVKINIFRSMLIAIPCGLLCWLGNTFAAYLIELLFPGKIAAGNSILHLFEVAANSFETILLILLVCVLAPVGEEIFFRAFIYPPLLMRVGRWKAMVIMSIFFAAMHLNIWSFFPLFVGGMGFALLYDKFRSLWMNICAHSAWNTLVIILYFIG